MELLAKKLHYSSEKEQKQEILKISERNPPNVGMAEWRHWLTKYTNKDLVSTFHNIATFHTTIPT